MIRLYTSTLCFAALACTCCLPGAPAIAGSIQVDFTAAMKQLSFDPAVVDGNKNAQGNGNGLLDAAEMALVSAILADESYDRTASGGTSHKIVRAAYAQALASATEDLKSLVAIYPTAPVVIAGYAVAGGKGSFEAIDAMCNSFGAPLSGDYNLALALEPALGPDGDADGDGVSNRDEYHAHIADGAEHYAAAALDPNLRTAGKPEPGVYWCPMRGRPCAEIDYAEAGACKDCGMPLITKAAYLKMAEEHAVNQKTVGIVLFTGFEVLDVYGPIEMWGYVKEFKIVTVAEAPGPVRSTQGLSTIADYSFADCPSLDILLVPGGIGTRRELNNPAMIDFIRAATEKAELVTSVCTGSALLAKAGVLDGHRATTNKRFFEVAASQSDAVTWEKSARWVEDGKFVTASGVSAGTDMALGVIRSLFGEERARQIAAGAEYTWNDDPNQDPFARK